MSAQHLASKHCKNMNHGRANVPINYCPECGLRFQSTAHGSCNMQKHTGYRKQRFGFCLDCGIKL